MGGGVQSLGYADLGRVQRANSSNYFKCISFVVVVVVVSFLSFFLLFVVVGGGGGLVVGFFFFFFFSFGVFQVVSVCECYSRSVCVGGGVWGGLLFSDGMTGRRCRELLPPPPPPPHLTRTVSGVKSRINFMLK